ncbi:hypothetical protein J6590_005465 [Homalodisca vitripennis]|nr:hypothetical protein J6590_005465 [Homalodisca vitripennis]
MWTDCKDTGRQVTGKTVTYLGTTWGKVSLQAHGAGGEGGRGFWQGSKGSAPHTPAQLGHVNTATPYNPARQIERIAAQTTLPGATIGSNWPKWTIGSPKPDRLSGLRHKPRYPGLQSVLTGRSGQLVHLNVDIKLQFRAVTRCDLQPDRLSGLWHKPRYPGLQLVLTGRSGQLVHLKCRSSEGLWGEE